MSATYPPALLTFPPPEPGDPIRVSATLFVSYARCPASAGARLDGLFGPESLPSFTGALTHRLIRRHLEAGPIPEEGVEQACREEIGSGLNMKMAAVGIRSLGQLRPVIQEAAELYRRFRTFPGEGFEGAEVELSAVPAAGMELVGKVDAVFREGGGVTLVDWKTGGLGDPYDQLLFYALAWTLMKGEAPSRVEAVSIATGERTETVPTLADLAQLAGRVSAMVTQIRRAWASRSALTMSGGPWCRYCPILTDCPEGTAAVAVLGEGAIPPPSASR